MAAALIAKAILGSIGGGFEGAAKPYTSGNSGVKASGTGAEKVGAKDEEKTGKAKPTEADEAYKVISNAQTVQSNQQAPTTQAFNAGNLSNIGKALGNFPSDERLKEVYGDSLNDSIIENFSKIGAIEFRYTDEAQKEYGGNASVDDKEHIGVKAQELEANPVTKGTVETDGQGNLEVNANHLTAANTAAIAELSRQVLALEEFIKEQKNGLK